MMNDKIRPLSDNLEGFVRDYRRYFEDRSRINIDSARFQVEPH